MMTRRQWLNSAGTAFRHLCLAFHHVKLQFHHLKLSFHHLAMTFRQHLGEIIKMVATRGQILRLKCTKYYFGAPPQTPLGRLQRLPRTTGRGRPTSKGIGGWKGKGGERIEERKGRKGRGRNVAFHHLLLSNLTTARRYGCFHVTFIKPRLHVVARPRKDFHSA